MPNTSPQPVEATSSPGSTPGRASTWRVRGRGGGTEGNARLTASNAAVLLVLLLVEGLTIVSVGALLSIHVFVGALLVPPVLLKTASTLWRFARYYTGHPDYVQKGPPPMLLRLMGPFVVVLTTAVLATGIVLMYVSPGSRSTWLTLHKVTFILWFGAMTVHVLGHVVEVSRVGPLDWVPSAVASRSRPRLGGVLARRSAVIVSVVLGAVLGVVLLGQVGPWLSTGFGHGG